MDNVSGDCNSTIGPTEVTATPSTSQGEESTNENGSNNSPTAVADNVDCVPEEIGTSTSLLFHSNLIHQFNFVDQAISNYIDSIPNRNARKELESLFDEDLFRSKLFIEIGNT